MWAAEAEGTGRAARNRREGADAAAAMADLRKRRRSSMGPLGERMSRITKRDFVSIRNGSDRLFSMTYERI